MLKISNGANTLIVTNGAFKSHFKDLGYKIVKDSKKASKKEKTDEEPITKEEETGEKTDEQWSEEQMLVPIGNWKKEDLAKFVEINEIEIGDAKKVPEVKEIVQAWIKENSED